jgi:hypothetical protein
MRIYNYFCHINNIQSKIYHSLMELSPSLEAAYCAATQEFPSILRNPKIHYRVHTPLVPILIQVNSIHTIPPYFSKIHFNIVHSTTFWSSQYSLSFWLYVFLTSAMDRGNYSASQFDVFTAEERAPCNQWVGHKTSLDAVGKWSFCLCYESNPDSVQLMA